MSGWLIPQSHLKDDQLISNVSWLKNHEYSMFYYSFYNVSTKYTLKFAAEEVNEQNVICKFRSKVF